MNTEQMIPIDFSRNITLCVLGDEIFDSRTCTTFEIKSKSMLTALNSGAYINADSSDENYFVVSFAARPNIGKQPVPNDVIVDLIIKAKGLEFVGKDPSTYSWTIRDHPSDISTWTINHAALLAKFKSDQGANMNTFTKENTLEATHVEFMDDGPIFKNADNETFLYIQESRWTRWYFVPKPDAIKLSYPTGERKEDHTIDGVTTYALRYKLDLLTEEATHCYKKCPTFYRLTLGKYAAVLKNNNQWVSSDCTTNEELNGPEFFALDADQDNHKEAAHHIELQAEKLGNQQQNHIDLAIAAGAINDVVISPDEPLKDGDVISVPYDELPSVNHPDWDVKPVFTQAMADAGEFPPIGSLVDYEQKNSHDNENFIYHGQSINGFLILESVFNKALIKCSPDQVKPIDNREPEEKLMDVLMIVLNCDQLMAEQIVYSDEFTITLKD